MKDKNNQVIVSATKMTSGVDDFLYSITTTSYSNSGVQVEVRLPNYYSKLGSDQQSFVSTNTQNPLGKLVRRWETDTKLSRAIYDSLGRLQFSQTNQEALDAADRYTGYRKYDLLVNFRRDFLILKPFGNNVF